MVRTKQVQDYDIISDSSLSTYTGINKKLLFLDGRCWLLCTRAVDTPNNLTSLTADLTSNVYYFTTTTLQPNAGTLIQAAASLGSNKFWLVVPIDGVIHAKWFGGAWNGSGNDSAAIQAAVNWAKLQYSTSGGLFRQVVQLPTTQALITTCINCTNTNGLVIRGSGGGAFNTCVTGNTSASDGSGTGIMFDFTCSTASGLKNITLVINAAVGNTASKIGVLFALSQDENGNQLGGLNCLLRECYFQFDDRPTINAGFGTIGVLNIRSEEFTVAECLIKANTPIILSSKADLSDTGKALTTTSEYATIKTGTGSMGVVRFGGQNSLQAVEKRSSGLVLNGTNSISFDGYISRTPATNGTEETAVLLTGVNQNIRLSGTIESFSRAIQATGELENSDFNFVLANQTAATTEVINVTGCQQKGTTLKIAFGNPSEFNNSRVLVYHAPVNSGNSPASGIMKNCTITCSDWLDNTKVISANLLKRANNCLFYSGQPFSIANGSVRQLVDYTVSLGTAGSLTSTPVMHFTRADNATTTSNNAGYYRVKVSGIIRIGSAGSGGGCVASVDGSLIVIQAQNGNLGNVTTTVNLREKSQISEAASDISTVTMSLSFSSGSGSIFVVPTCTGTDTGEPVSFQGIVEVMSDFPVNQSVLFA